VAEAAREDFCPYVGLQPFTARDRAYFFGREREQRIISANLFAAPLTILYGPSAVGKSSVLQAGVVPRLGAEPRTAILYFATWQGDDYLARLKRECRACLEAAHGQPLDVDDQLPLDEWIATARKQFRGTVFLIFDQFEEYLLYHREEEATAFDGDLARIVNRPDVGANLLIGLRDDSLAKLNRFSKRIPNLMGNTLQLRRLTPEAAKQAVRGPLEQFNKEFPSLPPASIDDALIDRVLEEVRTEKVSPSLSGGVAGVHAGEETGLVETAFLQLVLTELWRATPVRSGARVLSTATLDSLGGAKAIVRRHVDQELAKLTKEGREIAQKLFQHLVTPTGAKYALRTEDLVGIAEYPPDRAAPVLNVLQALTAARLLRRIDPPERYEIFHDAFAVALLDWRQDYLQRERQSAVVRRVVIGAVAAAVIIGVAIYVRHKLQDAEETRLNLQVAVLRADRASAASDAARAAQASAESAARQAQLQLEAGQLALQAERAQMQGQVAKAQELAKEQAAKEQSAQLAKAEAARRGAEAKAKLAEADQSQAKINDVAQVAKDKGISILGVPPVQQGPPPRPRDGDEPKKEPPPKAPPEDPARADKEAIKRVLVQFEEAYSAKDIGALQKVFPDIDVRPYQNTFKSFNTVKWQFLDNVDEQIHVAGSSAELVSRVAITRTALGGRQPPQSPEPPRRFTLRKTAQGWVIASVAVA
jgi:conflict system STAND superfamily ATPase